MVKKIYQTGFIFLFLLIGGIHLTQGGIFNFSEKTLLIRTSTIEITIKGGIITSIKNLKTGEIYTDSKLPVPTEKMFKKSNKVMPDYNSECEFKKISKNEGEIIYRELVNGSPGDTCIYRIKINGKDIGIQTIYNLKDSTKTPEGIPVINLKGSSVILGRGVKYTRKDREIEDYSVRLSNGIFAPPIAIEEFKKSCILFYPLSFDGRANVVLYHKKECDNLILTSKRDYREKDKTHFTSVVWNIKIFPDWFEAAKFYRSLYKSKTGAKFLWENPGKWIRNIHAVHTGIPGGSIHGNPSKGESEKYYENLSKIIDPEKILLFYWNGNGIVAFGDHRYMTKLGGPKKQVIDAIKKYNLKWVAYHPYVLFPSPSGVKERLELIKAKGWGLPENYKFTPDYGGKPEDVFEYFRPVAAGYYSDIDNAKRWVLNIGSKKVRNYLIRNISDYCKFHRADGVYLDVLGTDSGRHFPENKRVMDGLNWQNGENVFLREFNKKYPDILIMSEYDSEWVVPYVSYTWSGMSDFHHPTAPEMNHPLETVIWGSFIWKREGELTPYQSALTGALPELDITSEWSIARAKLFTEEELFNDIPSKWDKNLIASYRGKNGRIFQYRKLPFGQAYVENIRGKYKVKLGIFYGVYKSPLKEPVKISGWCAYKNNRPIGLNPDAKYPFTIQKPLPEGDYRITGLPEKSYIKAIRNGEKWSVVEFGTAENRSFSGEIIIDFYRDCLRICTGEKDINGPFKKGDKKKFNISLPGGLVFIWEEPEPVDIRFRSNLISEKGKLLPNGIRDNKWCYNSFTSSKNITLGGETYPSVVIGYGRYRGYSEGWVKLAKNSSPVLKFDIGYFPHKVRRSVKKFTKRKASVLVNGCEVWKEEITGGNKWQSVEIPLKDFAGRKVLITLSAEVANREGIIPHPGTKPVYFGRVRIDNNPFSLERKVSKLPQPEKIIFKDFFNSKKLDSKWIPEISPENAKGGSIKVENGVLVLISQHYKYCYVYRHLNKKYKNISVQARIKTHPSGGNREWNPGIGFYWGKKKYCFITAGGYLNKEAIRIMGYGAGQIKLKEEKLPVLDDNSYDFWVKISLGSEKIRYFYSLDGNKWKLVKEIPRPKDIMEAPNILIVGRGSAGENKYFSNDAPYRYFFRESQISELIVGQE